MSFFGVNIKKIRQVKGLSQKAFADLFDLNRGVISAYEEGRAEPKIETVLKVAHHFNLDLDDFLTKTLLVNNLVSSSNIDKLMFIDQSEQETTYEKQIIKNNLSPEEIILQKILANSDLIYEIKTNADILHYQTGDILFLREADLNTENKQTLYIFVNGKLQSYTNSAPEKVYKICGYFSAEQKNILSSILERIEILEKNKR